MGATRSSMLTDCGGELSGAPCAGAAAWLCGGAGSADLQPVMMLIHESTTVKREAVPARRTGFIADSSGLVTFVAAVPRVPGDEIPKPSRLLVTSSRSCTLHALARMHVRRLCCCLG